MCSDGIMPPPNVETVPLGALAPKLQTGDLVLFSGATSSGAIIKFFDHAQFSHVGIVSCVFNALGMCCLMTIISR